MLYLDYFEVMTLKVLWRLCEAETAFENAQKLDEIATTRHHFPVCPFTEVPTIK